MTLEHQTLAAHHWKLFLEMCSDWSNGRYKEAKEKYDGIGLPSEAQLTPAAKGLTPKVIVELGELMKEINEDKDKFFANPLAVTWYTHDAYYHAHRLTSPSLLINEHVRSRNTDLDRRNAFTRAYALHETLVSARIAMLLRNGEILKILPKDDKDTAKEKTIEELLPRQTWEKIQLLERGVSGRVYRKEKYPVFSTSGHNIKTLQAERNDVVHGWRKVNQHFEALDLAKMNLENFVSNWVSLPKDSLEMIKDKKSYTRPDWADLLEACGINLPVRKALQKQK